MEDVTRFVLLKRRSDLTHQQFSDYWSTKHVEVLLSAGLRNYNVSYTQNHFEALTDGATESLRFDGGPQMLQKDPSVIQKGFQQDPLYASLVRPDEEHFLDADKGVTLFTDVAPIKAGAKTPVKLMIFASFKDRNGHGSEDALREWEEAFIRDNAELIPLCTHYHTIESRGPTPHFDVVIEYGVTTDTSAKAVFSLIEEDWPAAIERENAFPVISHPRTFY
ncbi:EthD domain-containing protein [Caballeronia sp. J97]|uniref:EthD domain-containing protein n=1 Tax=Caballeronia sp. J97 TaxID=2805429 RepID=UPI002AAF18F2|nr:EthD domain-containing protein [Caballeronia sp. J97]